MSIIRDLEKAKLLESVARRGPIDTVVFIRTLEELKVDKETILECLEEPPEAWENFINYFK